MWTDRTRVSTAAALLVAALTGCHAPANPAATQQSPIKLIKAGEGTPVVSNTDPSASKLHDISGALLAYFALHKRLPDSFEQMQEVADMTDGPIDAACPGSDVPYVYTPDGIKLQDREQRVVVYEPAPLHHNFRLAIVLDEPKDNAPLRTYINAMPESFFLLHPPERRPPAAPTVPTTTPLR